MRGFAQHQRLRVEPATLIEQAAEADTVDAVLLDRVFVVDAGDKTFIGDVQQSHTGRLVDTARFRLDNAIFNLVAHAETVTPADAVSFQH